MHDDGVMRVEDILVESGVLHTCEPMASLHSRQFSMARRSLPAS
jgi:hypothetical protein